MRKKLSEVELGIDTRGDEPNRSVPNRAVARAARSMVGTIRPRIQSRGALCQCSIRAGQLQPLPFVKTPNDRCLLEEHLTTRN